MPGHFEAKKHAYRQTQEGIVVSFVIHPNDLNAEFAIAALGTRYMVAFAEIGDDGRPITDAIPAPTGKLSPVEVDAKMPKDRRPFASLPLSQQCAIRCGDAAFLEYIGVANAEAAAQFIRRRCKVESRAFITDGSFAGDAWNALERDYQAHLTTRQYADARR